MNQLVHETLGEVLQSQEGKRRVLEWLSTLIGEDPQETLDDNSSTTGSLSEIETRSGLMSHSDRNGLIASSGGPEETRSTASSGGPEETGSTASLGGPG